MLRSTTSRVMYGPYMDEVSEWAYFDLLGHLPQIHPSAGSPACFLLHTTLFAYRLRPCGGSMVPFRSVHFFRFACRRFHINNLAIICLARNVIHTRLAGKGGARQQAPS